MLWRIVPVAALLTVLLPVAGSAAPHDGKPKILLHLTHPTTKGILCDRGIVANCTDADVNGDLYPNGKSYFLYVQVAPGDLGDIAGLQLSVDYDSAPHSGVDIFGWTYCVDAHFEAPGIHGSWPAPLSSNLLTWDVTAHCQSGETAIAGYFYMAAYTPDVFRLLPRQNDGISAVASCDFDIAELGPGDLGRIAFSSAASTPGCNPCVEDCTTATPAGKAIAPASVPVVTTTWTALKNLY
jgi:hypothetical protein